jgi:hypothetical protein
MIGGAHYGYDAIPPRWLGDLQRHDMTESVYLPFIEKVIILSFY